MTGPECSRQVEGSLKTWARGKDPLPGTSTQRNSPDHQTSVPSFKQYSSLALNTCHIYDDKLLSVNVPRLWSVVIVVKRIDGPFHTYMI